MYTIKGVVSHHAIHDDELFALWLAQRFGAKIFVGIATALLQLVDSGLRSFQGKTAQEWLAKGWLFVGTGGGDYDEHSKPAAERKEYCSASLMAEKIGMKDHPVIKQMLEHAVRVDRTASAHGFDLSALIKAWHRNEVSISKVRALYNCAMDAVFMVMAGRVLREDWQARPTLDALAAEWMIGWLAPEGYDKSKKFATAFDAAKDMGCVGSRVVEPLLRYLLSDKTGKDCPFMLDGIVAAMNQDGATDHEIREFVFTSLDAKLAEQVRFMKACKELQALRKAGKLYVRGHQWRIIHVVSDNVDMNRAVRWIDGSYDVFIQRNTNGHVTIWYNKAKFNANGVAAYLRIAEREAHGIERRLPWKNLISEGTLMRVPWWYYNVEGGQLMNGSLTNLGTPVTHVSDQTIWKIIKNELKLKATAA